MTKIKEKFASNDLIFKYLFGINENKKFTIYLLETIFNLPHGTIKYINIINSIKFTPNKLYNKKLELDVYIEIPSLNLNVIIEMQDTLNNSTLKKAYTYLSSSVPEIFKSGEKSFDKHPDVMLIILANKFSKDLKDYDDIYIHKGIRKGKTILNDLSKIEIIDLAKYDVNCYNWSVEESVLSFIRVNNKDDMKKLLESVEENEIIKEMNAKMKGFKNKKYVQKYWIEEVMRRTEKSMSYDEGKEVGFNNGFNEGETNKQYEIAKKMVKENEPIDKIKLFTDLPTKEINKLVKSLK